MDDIFKLESQDGFTKVISEIIQNIHKSNQFSCAEMENKVIEAAKDEVRKLLISLKFDIDEIAKHMKSNSWEQERIEQFVSLLKLHKLNVLNSIMMHHNSSFADVVTEFNWFAKLILGTSEYKVLKYPIIQLLLTTINSSGNQSDTLFELSKDSLGKLITKLECLERNYHSEIN